MLYALSSHNKLKKELIRFCPKIPEQEGICHGFTLMWLQAAITSTEALDKFYDRVRYAIVSNKIKEEIETCLKEKISSELSEGELSLLEMRPFFECMAMYQAPELFQELFNEKISQNNIDDIFMLVRNKQLEEKSFSFCTIGPLLVSEHELKEYLILLEEIITSKSESQEKIGFLVGSDMHSVGIYFDVAIKKWAFININMLDIKKNWHQEMNAEELAEKLYSSFKLKRSSFSELPLTIKTIISSDDIKMVEDFKSLRNKHYEKLFLEDKLEELLFLAVYDEQIDIVGEILSRPSVDVNYINSSLGVTSLIAASVRNNFAIVKRLLEHQKIDIYITDDSGKTAYDIAYENENWDIVKLLEDYTSVHFKRKAKCDHSNLSSKRIKY